LRKDGLSEVEARRTAHRRVGNLVQSEENFYESSRWIWLEQLQKDIFFAFRQLAHSKGFTVVALLTLALGIGANTAVFTLVHAVMLQSLAVANPGELYRLGDTAECCTIGGHQARFSIYSYSLYRYLREHTAEFDELAAFNAEPGPFSVRRAGVAGPPTPLKGEFVSGNYFSMFGVHAAAGRVLTAADDSSTALPAAVLSYRTWEQRYARDPGLIGSALIINGAGYTIAGVAASGFFGDTLRADPPDFWLPLSAEPIVRGQSSILNHDGDHWLYIIGRLKSAASPARVEAEVNLELEQWFLNQEGANISPQARDEIRKQHIRITAAGGGVGTLKSEYTDGLRLLMVVSALVLLIACANIANLLLARGTAGRIQASVRLALGAPRHRLMRQSLIESILLSVCGGAAGLAVAYIGTRAILLLAFHGSKFVPIQATPSLPVLGFAFLLSLLTGLVFGVIPAWTSAHFEPAEVLRGANRSTGNRSSLPQKSLVVLQAALSLVLLAYAGILTKSLRNLEHQQFGFETANRVMISVSPAFTGYSPDRVYAVYQQLQERLPQVPGVQSASLSQYSPMEGTNWSSGIHFEGRPASESAGASWLRVSPNYFETIGTHLIRGRLIDQRDTPNSRGVAVVTQNFATKFLKDQDPIGKRFGMDNPSDYEIVGIVEDAKYADPRDNPWPTFFLPLLQMTKAQWASPGLARSNNIHDIELRVTGSAKDLEPAIRNVIARIDPNLSVLKVRSFSDQVSGNFNQERLLARLTGLFGLLALIVATVGLYGITSYSVVRRTSEIGVRIALGASRATVVGLIIRSAVFQIGLGLALGIPVALWGGSILANRLYGVTANDPLLLAGAAIILGGCGLVAGLIPAFRASGIDPIRALRTE
ncbi:MAG TPA: ABC transporter permease, partial [Bryobacteraceae bacterium]|nr:ABC transporter permease [Bryobacteraceae bacterium]